MSGGGRPPPVRKDSSPGGAPRPGTDWEASMAGRNLLRSLAAASLLAVTSGAALAVAVTPASAVDSNLITVTVTDAGFSQTAIDARVGDRLVFHLDDNAQQPHTLAWDD